MTSMLAKIEMSTIDFAMGVRSSIWKRALPMHLLFTRELEGEESNGSWRCTAQTMVPRILRTSST